MALCEGFELNKWDLLVGAGELMDELNIFDVKNLVAEAISHLLGVLGLKDAANLKGPLPNLNISTSLQTLQMCLLLTSVK